MALTDFLGELRQSIAPDQNIRDFQHASRTFIDSLYRLSPKLSTLFHVFIDLNEIVQTDQISQIEIGLMAKQIQLPRFNVQTKTHNSYNRKMVQQERINYDPVGITFHDDSADQVVNFWKNYYQYYYRDSDYLANEETYRYDSKYQQRQQQAWGYSPVKNDGNQNYIKAIRIYSLHQKRFTSYNLIRPTITSFAHGQLVAGDYAPLEHTMQVQYEAMLYDSGPVSSGVVQGFDVIHYDKTPSPLRNAGAALGGIEGVIKGVQHGDLGAIVHGGINVFNIFTGSDVQLKQAPSIDLSNIGNGILRGQNPFSSVFAPTSSTVQQGIRKAIGGSSG